MLKTSFLKVKEFRLKFFFKLYFFIQFCSHSFQPINRFEFWRNILKMTESQKAFSTSNNLSENDQTPVHQLVLLQTKKLTSKCYSFFEDGTKLKIFSEIYLSLTAMNWLYGRMNRFHLPWTKVQPKFERKCRPSIIILVWSYSYFALAYKFHSFQNFFELFCYIFYFVKNSLNIFLTSELRTKGWKKGN